MYVDIRHEDERARCYPEGGTAFHVHVRGIGWVVDDQPSCFIQALAAHMQRELGLRRRGISFDLTGPEPHCPDALDRRLAELEQR